MSNFHVHMTLDTYDFDDVEGQHGPRKWSATVLQSILDPKGTALQRWNKIFVVSCVIAVSLDPLFLYIPIIDDKNKCVGMDRKLRTVALVLRSLTDIIFVMHIIRHIRTKMEASEATRASGWKWMRSLLSVSIVIDFLALLPIPQLAVLVVFYKLRNSAYLVKGKILTIFLLLQYVPSVYRVHLSSKKLQETQRWVKGAFNLFQYILASHVLGAFWYFFSIQRETTCWEEACKRTKECNDTYFCSDGISKNLTFINEFCPVDPENAAVFNFGMFLDALKSGNTGLVNFPRKFFYCFWWGIRNLSNFGTSLVTSSYVWENCFAILISVIGLLIILYLIGNLQTYMQWAAAKAEEKREEEFKQKIKMKERGILDWTSKNGLPEELKTEIMNFINQNDIVKKHIDDDVDMKFLFSIDLPQAIQTSIKNHAGMNALKKVAVFQGMDEVMLKTICHEHLEMRIYPKNSYILRMGKQINLMLFIIEGTVQAREHSSMVTTSTSDVKGELFVEELVHWVSPRISFPDLQLPTSTQNFNCQTNVEAFVLMVDSLISVVSAFRPLWNRSLYHISEIDYQQLKLLLTQHSHNKIVQETYLQLWEDNLKLQKMKISKEKDALAWVSRNGLPEDLKTEIMKNVKEINPVTTNIDVDVDVVFLFSVLSQDAKEAMKLYAGVNVLKKVPILGDMPESSLKVICGHLEPVIYPEKSYLIEAGESLNMMLFIVEGVVAWPNTNSYPEYPGSNMISQLCLMKGDLYGEELLSWASPSSSLSDLPISTEDVKCHKKLEGLALSAHQLQNAVSGLGMEWSNYLIAPPKDHDEAYLQILVQANRQMTATKLDKIDDEELKWKMRARIKHNDILDWLSRNGVRKDLTTELMMDMIQNNRVETNMDADVNMQYIVSYVKTWGISDSILKYLSMSKLKKVPMLQNMHEEVLDYMSNMLKPVVFERSTYIVRAGEPHEKIFIITQGTLMCRSNTSSSSLDTTYLGKGDFYGEELLNWASPSILFSGSAPISIQDVKCHTEVEAFAISADDLRSTISNCCLKWMSTFTNGNNSQKLEEWALPYKPDQIYAQVGSTTLEEIEDAKLRQKMKIMIKWSDILNLLSKYDLLEDTKTIIWTNLRIFNIVEKNIDADVNLTYLVNNFPDKYMKEQMTREFCMSTLKKVPTLATLDETLLVDVCNRFQPVIYAKDSYIVWAGQPLDCMFIIVQGVITRTEMMDGNAGRTRPLGKGDFFPEYYFNNFGIIAASGYFFPRSHYAPISAQDVKCQTDVEAFMFRSYY